MILQAPNYPYTNLTTLEVYPINHLLKKKPKVNCESTKLLQKRSKAKKHGGRISVNESDVTGLPVHLFLSPGADFSRVRLPRDVKTIMVYDRCCHAKNKNNKKQLSKI